MRNYGRSRAFIPAVVVVVVVLVGFFAMVSRGDDGGNKNVNAVEREPNCSPIARADAAATRPGEAVLVDVLSNDTDADGDTLVFQILSTDGGTSEIDDGDTPTDSSDDRLSFTPTDPPNGTATIEYQALDPEGGFSASTVTVAVNPEAMLPDGVRSALATDPSAEGTESGRCGEPVDTTTTSVDTTLVEDVTTTTQLVEEEVQDTTETTRRTTRTTTKGSTSTKRTTTTTKKPSSGGGGSTNTTRPSQSPPTTDDSPSVTAPGEGGSPGTTSPPTTQPQEEDNPCSKGRNTPECQKYIDDHTPKP